MMSVCQATSLRYTVVDCRTTQQNIFNVAGALYAATLFLGVSNSSSVQPIMSIERGVFYRERAAGKPQSWLLRPSMPHLWLRGSLLDSMQHTLLDIVHLTLWTLDVNLILQPAGMYGVLPYALAQFTIELPYIMFQVVLYSVITYSMIQFEWTAAKFFW